MFNVAATVPTYNVKPTCRAAIDLAGVIGRTAEMCEASESRARGDIVKGWPTFSETAKVRCLQPTHDKRRVVSSSWVCLESMRDSQKGQEKDKPANPTNKP
jgi:hypothetical protein